MIELTHIEKLCLEAMLESNRNKYWTGKAIRAYCGLNPVIRGSLQYSEDDYQEALRSLSKKLPGFMIMKSEVGGYVGWEFDREVLFYSWLELVNKEECLNGNYDYISMLETAGMA